MHGHAACHGGADVLVSGMHVGLQHASESVCVCAAVGEANSSTMQVALVCADNLQSLLLVHNI